MVAVSEHCPIGELGQAGIVEIIGGAVTTGLKVWGSLKAGDLQKELQEQQQAFALAQQAAQQAALAQQQAIEQIKLQQIQTQAAATGAPIPVVDPRTGAIKFSNPTGNGTADSNGGLSAPALIGIIGGSVAVIGILAVVLLK